MENRFLDYLKTSNDMAYNNPVGDKILYGIRLYIKEPIESKIDLKGCFDYVFGRMPKKMYQNVECITIGNFPFLNSRKVEAVYKDGTIYLTNQHEDETSLISDIVHEVAHSFEEQEQESIYKDGLIKSEFLSKREALFRMLDSHGLIDGYFTIDDFLEPDYNEEIDLFFYKTVGYEKIQNIAGTLFISPYAATSLREYFANAFENFFVDDYQMVKKISPNVFNKIIKFLEF